jgi:hypothetical protein
MNRAWPGPPLRWFEYAVALLPVALAFTGAIGFAVGPAACALNLAIMGWSVRRVFKFAAALVIAVLAFFVWAFAVVSLH